MSIKIRKPQPLMGLLLAAPLFLWVATGILFHTKYSYSEGYEHLAIPARPEPTSWRDAVLSPAELTARFNLLFNHPLHTSSRETKTSTSGSGHDLHCATSLGSTGTSAIGTPGIRRTIFPRSRSSSARSWAWGLRGESFPR